MYVTQVSVENIPPVNTKSTHPLGLYDVDVIEFLARSSLLIICYFGSGDGAFHDFIYIQPKRKVLIRSLLGVHISV